MKRFLCAVLMSLFSVPAHAGNFGNENIESSIINLDQVTTWMKATTGSSPGILDSIYFYCSAGTGGDDTFDFKASLYSNTSSAPDALLSDGTATTTVDNSGAALRRVLVPDYTLSASTTYWLGLQVANVFNVANFYYTATSGNDRGAETAGFRAWPDPADDSYTDGFLYTAFGSWRAAAAAAEAIFEVHSAIGAKVVHGPGTAGKKAGPE